MGSLGREPLVALLGNAQLHSLALRQRDVRLGALANDKYIGETRGEHMTLTILNVDNVKRSWMSLTIHHSSHTTQIASSSDHAQISCGKIFSFSGKILGFEDFLWEMTLLVVVSPSPQSPLLEGLLTVDQETFSLGHLRIPLSSGSNIGFPDKGESQRPDQ